MSGSNSKLNVEDYELVYAMAERLTGNCHQGEFRREIILKKVEQRIAALNQNSFSDYISYLDTHPDELPILISNLTIHTTSWFRENPHFKILEDILLQTSIEQKNIKIWSCAGSSGEEAYSAAMVCEEFCSVNADVNYQIHSSDIDPVSVRKGERAIYHNRFRPQIPEKMSKYVLVGNGNTDGLFTLKKEVRNKVHFKPAHLLKPETYPSGPFDIIFCRNVLIYFDKETSVEIINLLLKQLKPKGHIIFGHSEGIVAKDFNLHYLGHMTYQVRPTETESRQIAKERLTSQRQQDSSANQLFEDRPASSVLDVPTLKTDKPIILVIDDSKTIRLSLMRIIPQELATVFAVGSATAATKFLEKNQPSLITLDINMPGQQGIEWLKERRALGLKTPIVIISNEDSNEIQQILSAIEGGAVDSISKEHLHTDKQGLVVKFSQLLKTPTTEIKIQEIKKPTLSIGYKGPSLQPDVILIGASTGGPGTLFKILKDLPSNTPPILVVQHIASGFNRPFALSLSEVSTLKLGQTNTATPIERGHIYMSTGDFHIEIQSKNDQLYVAPQSYPPVNGHKPSVEVLFQSAILAKSNNMAILLTGMGNDGAQSLLEIKDTGGYTIAQDKKSSVVHGMPGVAIRIGAAQQIGSIEQIRELILHTLTLPIGHKDSKAG